MEQFSNNHSIIKSSISSLGSFRFTVTLQGTDQHMAVCICNLRFYHTILQPSHRNKVTTTYIISSLPREVILRSREVIKLCVQFDNINPQTSFVFVHFQGLHETFLTTIKFDETGWWQQLSCGFPLVVFTDFRMSDCMFLLIIMFNLSAVPE